MNFKGVEEIYTAPNWSGGDFKPPADNTYLLGNATYSWKELHVETVIYATSVVGNWSPSADDTYWLGTSILGWKGLHMPDTLITDDTGYVKLRNNANDAYVGLMAGAVILSGNITMPDAGAINTGVVDSDYFTIGAVDNDTNTITELMRFAGAVVPYVRISNKLQVSTNLQFYGDNRVILAREADDAYVQLKARDSSTDSVEVARFAGAADPYFQIGRDDTGVATDAVCDMLWLQAGAGTGNESANFGLGISILIGNAASEVEERGSIDLVLTTNTNGSEASKLVISTMAAGAIAATLDLSNDATKSTILGVTGDYWRIGDAGTTAHTLNSEDDLMVTGEAEVKTNLYVDGDLYTGTLDIDDDSGAVTLVDMGVTASPADGAEESIGFAIDGNVMLKLYTEANSAGAVDTFQVRISASTLQFRDTFLDDCIDFTNVTINHTGGDGPAWLRGGTYGSPVANADEDQSGMIRFYGETSADGSSYDRGVFVCLKTTGTKGVFPVSGLAEVLAQSGNGPAQTGAAQFIAHMNSATAKIDARSGNGWANFYGAWLKITSEVGSIAASGSVIAPLWVDTQMNGTVSGEYYSIFATSGTAPDAFVGFEAAAGQGWTQLFYFDDTCYNLAPVSNQSLKVLLDTTQYYIPLSTTNDAFTQPYSIVIADTKAINTGLANGDYYTLGAVDDDDNLIDEVARVTGGTQPSIDLKLGRFGTSVLTADAAHRGMFYFTEGASSVADLLYCIMKETDDSYSAVQVAVGATS